MKIVVPSLKIEAQSNDFGFYLIFFLPEYRHGFMCFFPKIEHGIVKFLWWMKSLDFSKLKFYEDKFSK